MGSFTAARALLDSQHQKNSVPVLSSDVSAIPSPPHVRKKEKVLGKREGIDPEDTMKASKGKAERILGMPNPDSPNVSCPLAKENERPSESATGHRPEAAAVTTSRLISRLGNVSTPDDKNHAVNTAGKHLLADPSIAQRNVLALDQELKRNREAFHRTLRTGNVIERGNLKRRKVQLLQRQAAWLAAVDRLQSYKDLMLQKNALVEKALEAYDQDLISEGFERSIEETASELSKQEISLSSCLADAGIEDGTVGDECESTTLDEDVVGYTQPTQVHSHTSRARTSELASARGIDREHDHDHDHFRFHGKNLSSGDRHLDPVDHGVPHSNLHALSHPIQSQHLQTPKSPQLDLFKKTSTPDCGDDFDVDADLLNLVQELERCPTGKVPPVSNWFITSKDCGITDPSAMGEKNANKPVENQSPTDRSKYPWSAEVLDVLKSRFNMTRFRSNQLETINHTLAGKDTFVLMPTGGGKSLCYQLPAIVKGGNTHGVMIVVSPLISLMQDQVDHLKALNIQAVSFNGESSVEQRRHIMNTLRGHCPERYIELLYVTPEMINQSTTFREGLRVLYKKMKLARLVIDEAHCVSQWGHDFRPDYKELSTFRRDFPKVPIVALTATATPNVIIDVQHNIGIAGCQLFCQSFNRPNLYFEVRKRPKNVIEAIATLINNGYRGQTGIVYTLSRKSAETTAQKLQEQGIVAHHYHAGIEAEERCSIQQAWQQGEIKVVVATIAFGMGIDKINVRFVIHQTLPKSLEGYYQETGRAGRDGKPSECYMYYSYGDVVQLRKMINEGEGSEAQKERQRNMLETVTAFADNQGSCRRVEVLRYFGETFNKADCHSSCDNCRAGRILETKDYTDVAVAALEILKLERRLTLVQCIEILLGQRQKRHFERLRGPTKVYFGFAKKTPKHDVHRIIDKLRADKALVEENVFNKTVGMAFQYFSVSYVLHGSWKLRLTSSDIQLGPNASKFVREKQKLMLTVETQSSRNRALRRTFEAQTCLSCPACHSGPERIITWGDSSSYQRGTSEGIVVGCKSI